MGSTTIPKVRRRVPPMAVCLIVLLSDRAVSAVDYESDIKPLLAQKCYSCHGAFKQQGNFRLDTAEFLRKGGDSGAAVDQENPQQSLLLKVLTGEAGFRMPPENEGTPTTEAELALIREWIVDGAKGPDGEQPQQDPAAWWSYQPVRRPDPPRVAQPDWCRDPIDQFIAAGWEQAGISGHAEEADPPVWLRRVYLDLIGLPPTREELHRFLADLSPDAREKVVDDLLSRPQYGERWGRHWMDIWRYSDWYGSRGINEIRYSQRHIWRWRDWIVNSLNEDKGYDRMILEMLAGDEIAGDRADIVPATGYLGRSWYKFDRNVWLFETVERTAEAFLGVTLRCARCHDHKYDPIGQEEYYRFRAFFEPHDVRTDPLSAFTKTEKDATLGEVLSDGLPLVYDKHLDVPTYLFQRGDSRYPDETRPLTPGVPSALGGTVDVQTVQLPPAARLPVLRPEVRSTLIAKANADVVLARQRLEAAESAVLTAERKVAEARLNEANQQSTANDFLTDDFSAPRPDRWQILSGDWNYEDGRLAQKTVGSFCTIVTKENHPSDFRAIVRYRTLQPGSFRSVGFSFDSQDQGNSQDVYTSVNDNRPSVQAFHRLNGQQHYPQAGIVYTDLKIGEEITLDVTVIGSKLTIDLNGTRKLDYPLPVERRSGKFALWVHSGAAEFLDLKITAYAESPETLASKAQSARREADVARAELHVAEMEAASLSARLAATLAKYGLENSVDATTTARLAAQAERDAAVARAELELAKIVEPDKLDPARQKLESARLAAQTPGETFSPPGEEYPSTSTGHRSALAQWITNPANPRTARVAVNHIWGRHFGRPLVETVENFGLNGRKPSHPELLDWLAAELIAEGWRMKALHRRIVLSATYRMSSANRVAGDSPAILKECRDIDPDNRLLWRMNSRRMEAELVRDSLFSIADRLDLTPGGPEIPENQGESTPRRSLYFRNTPNEKMPLLEVFDVADPNACYRRKESIVPGQSLALMNSGLALDQARLVARRLSADPDFVTAAFEAVLCRAPNSQELERCLRFLRDQESLAAEATQQKYAGGGSSKVAPATDPATRAKENLVHVLLLHHEFVTIR